MRFSDGEIRYVKSACVRASDGQTQFRIEPAVQRPAGVLACPGDVACAGFLGR
jgi:hypothetical protein